MDSTWTHGILLALGQIAQSYAQLPTPHPNDQRHQVRSAALCALSRTLPLLLT